MEIIPFDKIYTSDLRKLWQYLRDHIISCETRVDDLILYNTDHEIDEYISDFHAWKNMILLVQEEDIIVGYGIWKIKEEPWEWTKIKKFWQIEQLFIRSEYRWRWFAQSLIQNFEKIFEEKWASHIEISVFALNTWAHSFYKKYGFEERLITLDKRI